jgi:hypothetical protein
MAIESRSIRLPFPDSSVRDAAVRYAESGCDLVVLHGVWVPHALQIACTCRPPVWDCPQKGAHPRWKDWLIHDGRDAANVRAWFDRYPCSNVGIKTAADDRLVVLEVDATRCGLENLQRLEAELGTIPPTLVARASTNLIHYYYRVAEDAPLPRNSKDLIAPGISVHGDGGGFAIAPPSCDAHGLWAWDRDGTTTIAEAPPWLLQPTTLQDPIEPVTARPKHVRKKRPGSDMIRILGTREHGKNVTAADMGSYEDYVAARALKQDREDDGEESGDVDAAVSMIASMLDAPSGVCQPMAKTRTQKEKTDEPQPDPTGAEPGVSRTTSPRRSRTRPLVLVGRARATRPREPRRSRAPWLPMPRVRAARSA